MKHFINTLFIVAMLAIGSAAVLAQVKVITESEYDAAINAAKAKTEGTFPRMVTTTYKSRYGDEDVSLNHYESAKRHTTTYKSTSDGIVSYIRSVLFDGVTLERKNDGVWARQGLLMAIDFDEPILTPLKFTVEDLSVGGKIVKLYTKNAIDEGLNQKKVYKYKIDALGRLVEYNLLAADTNLTTYEYPKTLPRIKKPKLGTKEDI